MSAFKGFRSECAGAMGVMFSPCRVRITVERNNFSAFLASYLPLKGYSVLFSAVEVVRHPIHSLFFAK